MAYSRPVTVNQYPLVDEFDETSDYMLGVRDGQFVRVEHDAIAGPTGPDWSPASAATISAFGDATDYFAVVQGGVTKRIASRTLFPLVLGYIDVTWHGAKADFDIATNTMTTDSTSAFQAAIDAAPYGGCVVVPPAPIGKAFCCGPLTINKPLTFRGMNRYGSRIVAKAGTTGYLLTLSIGTVGVHPREETHGFGYQVSDLYLDGNRRSPDIGGVRLFFADRVVMERMQIRNFAREAIFGQQTPRESEYRSLYIRWCGGPSYPAVNYTDIHTGDAANNHHFDGCKILYSFGEALHIEPTIAGSTRLFSFVGCMIHNVTPDLIDTETLHTADSDGWANAVTGRELETPLITLASARNIRFVACRLHSAGFGQPLIQIRAGVVDAPKTCFVIGCALGDVSLKTLSSVSVTSNVFTSVGHQFGTGALVRVTGSSLSSTTDYWLIRLSADTFSLAASLANARAGTPVVTVTNASGLTVTPQSRWIDQEGTNIYTKISTSEFTHSGTYRAAIINRTADATRATVTDSVTSVTANVETI